MNWTQSFRRWYYRWRYRRVGYVQLTDPPVYLQPGVCYVAIDQDVPGQRHSNVPAAVVNL